MKFRPVLGLAAIVTRLLLADPATAQVTRDSAGIHIIENPKPLWTAPQVQHLAPTPSLIIGTQPGPNYEFSRIAGVARLSDGRIVVGDGASLQLRFYDVLGKYLKTVGRKGEGPGEFQWLSQLQALAGDTLVAGFPSRLALFSASGTPVRRIDPYAPPVLLAVGERSIYAVFGGGNTIMGAIPHPVESQHFPQAGLRWTDSVQLALVSPGNALLKPLGRFPARVLEWGEGQDLRSPAFSPQLMVSNTAQLCFIGFGSAYSIRVYSSAGILQQIIRRTWVPHVSPAAKAPSFATLPAFSHLLADRTGRLWVRASTPTDTTSSSWSVFDTTGHWQEDVTMPARFSPMDIGADYILGVARDADGVETVTMYRLSAR